MQTLRIESVTKLVFCPATDMAFMNASISGSGLIPESFSRLESSASSSYLAPTPKQRPEKSNVSLTVISP